MSSRLSTGSAGLDRALGGGLAPGTAVVLRTPPESQGELLLKELALARDTLYLSTTRDEEAVNEWLSADPRWAGDGGVEVRYVRGLPVARGEEAVRAKLAAGSGWSGDDDPDGGRTLLEVVETATESFRGEGNVVVDPIDPIETGDEEGYRQFLHGLRDRLIETGGIAVLHAVETAQPPALRWLTLQMSDEVWEVSVDEGGDDVEFLLSITKSRRGSMPGERIKLELNGRVNIDTSRDIA